MAFPGPMHRFCGSSGASMIKPLCGQGVLQACKVREHSAAQQAAHAAAVSDSLSACPTWQQLQHGLPDLRSSRLPIGQSPNTVNSGVGVG